MSSALDDLRRFFDASPDIALVEVAQAKGSTPREKGAWMLVSPRALFGTIGGGQLEYMTIDKARQVLGARPAGPAGAKGRRRPFRAGISETLTLDIPLGPEIGQCCGGRVEVAISLVDQPKREMLLKMTSAEAGKRPCVYIFGGGHVGHALARAFSLLPVRTVVVETRADALDGMPETAETLLTPVPEEAVRDAPAGSAYVVLTHDHALDFLIVAEALKREDAAYVGMIGSKTKKATFRSWYLKTAGGTPANFSRLVSPIGGDAVRDKRPAVIAGLAAAEIMTALLVRQGERVRA